MVENTPPVTLLHISDLHIGELDPATGNARISSLARKLIANSSWFDGVLGHHCRGLEHLAQFWTKMRTQEPEAHLVVSGDVTSCGNLNELRNADEYLAAKLLTPVGRVGLDFTPWKDYAIPGNHDHWPGAATIFGKPVSGVKSQLLDGYPKVETIRRGGASPPIHLIRIDTDSDVSPYGRHRFFAIGDFQTQLSKAATKLASLAEPGIRVLVMHHSWHKSGILSISRASRGALAQFLEQESIRVVLTGHVHIPTVSVIDIPVKGGKSYKVLECRCGTTTQFDKMNYEAKTLSGDFPHRPEWPANTLLVHKITASPKGGATWVSESFVRRRGGFTSTKKTGTFKL